MYIRGNNIQVFVGGGGLIGHMLGWGTIIIIILSGGRVGLYRVPTLRLVASTTRRTGPPGHRGGGGGGALNEPARPRS